MRYERARAGADRSVPAFYGKGELAEAALDALAQHRHPSSTPLFVAQLTEQERRRFEASRSKGWRGSGDAGAVAAIEAALDRRAQRRVTLAGTFAAVMLWRAARSIADRRRARRVRRLRRSGKRYLVEHRARPERDVLRATRRIPIRGFAPTSPTCSASPAIRRAADRRAADRRIRIRRSRSPPSAPSRVCVRRGSETWQR